MGAIKSNHPNGQPELSCPGTACQQCKGHCRKEVCDMPTSLHQTKTTGDNHVAVPPKFSLEELAELHFFCLKFRALVRAGGTPTPEQEQRFHQFSAITYASGVAYVEP